MKPHEESWYRDHNSACRWEIRQTHSDGWRRIAQLEDVEFVSDEEREFARAQGARADLLAAAPDMARVLMSLEWTVSNSNGWAFCPSCWRQKDGTVNGIQVSVPDTHADDCALYEALRKAGVK